MVRQHYGRHVWLTAVVGMCGCLVPLCAGASPGVSAQSGMQKPLSNRPGDARRGKAVAVNSDRGNCVICHKLPVAELPAQAFGDLGPPLDGIGSRLAPAQLRLRIVNAKLLNPDTVMPSYHIVDGLHRVQARYKGRPILSAQEVEDLVAYLATLK